MPAACGVPRTGSPLHTRTDERSHPMMGNMRFAALAAAVVAAVFVGSVEQIAFAEDSHALTVKSVPVSGITITSLQGYAVGTTEYSVVCTDPVRLYAPTNAEVDGEYYRFVRWEVDGTPGNSSTSTYMVMDQDHVAVAVYTERVSYLTVKSLPMSGVAIGGDLPGTTEYTASCDYARRVTLIASASVMAEDGERPFGQWIVDGVEQAEGMATVEVTVDSNYVLFAVYREPHPSLWISSSPSILRAAIGGDKPGITDYRLNCDSGERVKLIAPAEIVWDNVTYNFYRWWMPGVLSWKEREFQITVNFSCYIVAVYNEQPSTLIVRSEPFSGIVISCPHPEVGPSYIPSSITTEYTKSLNHYADVIFSAPAEVQHDGSFFSFDRWILNGVEKDAGKTGLSFEMNGDKTAVAVYASTGHLEVSSSPFGIRIGGDQPGTTPYEAIWTGTVELSAPLFADQDDTRWMFNHWEIDGIAQPESQCTITVTMPPDHSLTAIYEIRQPQVHVMSTPITEIPISGDKPGTTNYTASCSISESVNLQAPEIITAGGVEYHFIRWTVGADSQNHPDPVIRINVDYDVDLTACYSDQQPTLTVSSSPCTGISITGSRPGTTDYTVTGEYLEEVTLQAPGSIFCSRGPCGFTGWIVDGRYMLPGETTARITLRGAHTALAMYGTALLRIQGPADRGEPPLPPGGGTFTVDVFLANAGPFVGFETAALQFLDASGNDAAFPIVHGPGGNPVFNNLAIAFNDARWPSIFPIYMVDDTTQWSRRLFGFMSMADSSVIEETWLCTVTYEYGPAAEGAYTIAGDPQDTLVVDDRGIIEHFELPGTVTIGLAADLNGDCIVNEADLIAVRGMLGQHVSPGMRGDLNADGVIDVRDLIILRNRMGKTCR